MVAAVAIAAIAIVIVVVMAAGGSSDDASSAGNNFPSGGSVPKQKQFDLTKAAAAAGCELKSNKANSREHLQDPNQKVKYATNPPNSGRHYRSPRRTGCTTARPRRTPPWCTPRSTAA